VVLGQKQEPISSELNDTKHPKLYMLWISYVLFVAVILKNLNIATLAKDLLAIFILWFFPVSFVYQKNAPDSVKIPHNFLGLS
jgi:hypothetical protein